MSPSVRFRQTPISSGRWRLPAIALCSFLAPFGAENGARAAGGAYVVDDVQIGKPGECKVESWAQAATNHDFTAVTSPTCVVNLGLPVEMGTQFSRYRSGDVWTTTTDVKAKANLVPIEGHTFGLGISGATGWDMHNGVSTGGNITLLATAQPYENLRISLNGGWLYDNVTKVGYATWGAGFEWAFMKPLTLIGEVFGQLGKQPSVPFGEAPAPETLRLPRAQLGLRLTPKDSVDIDLIYGHNITGENAHWLTLGLNLRF
jgi:hypothetical protein